MDIALIVQVLVAAGTLALASATFWLGMISIRERKAAQREQLAVSIYNPLRNEVSLWTDIEVAHRGASHNTWTGVKTNLLHLVSHMPKDMISQLNDAEPLVDRIHFLSGQVSLKLASVTRQIAHELRPQAPPDHFLTFRIMDPNGPQWLTEIDPTQAWLVRKTVRQWAGDYVAKAHPVTNWEIEVLAGIRVGGTKEVEELGSRVFTFFDKDKDALELRVLLEKLCAVGNMIKAGIEKELSEQ